MHLHTLLKTKRERFLAEIFYETTEGHDQLRIDLDCILILIFCWQTKNSRCGKLLPDSV